MYLVSFVVHPNIRVHSCPFVSIRGSESFRVFRVFRGSPQYSCPFVSIRGSESFSRISCLSWF